MDPGSSGLRVRGYVPVGVGRPLLSLLRESKHPTAKEDIPAGSKVTKQICLQIIYIFFFY